MKRMGWASWIWWASAIALLAAPVALLGDIAPAHAQFWKWPWEQDEEPRRRRPPPRLPPSSGLPGSANNFQRDPRGRPPVCLQLEQRLAEEANRGGQARNQLPEVERGIQDARRQARRAERELDRRGCYEQFLFTRSLKRTRRCVGLDRKARDASQKIRQLDAKKQQILGTGSRSYQDDIIRELADNNCGGVYQREARRRNPFSNFWQDEDSGDRRINGNTFAGLPFATYRTVCVRLCDGFYFPVSFSTLPTHFSRDSNVCQSQCAAPTELYFHQNPGQSVDQMVSQRSQQPYLDLKTAFRYRKEYVSGCSCKQAEFIPETASAEPGITPPSPLPAGPLDKSKRGQLSPVR